MLTRRSRTLRRLAYPSMVAVTAILPSLLGLACSAKAPPPSNNGVPLDADNNGVIDTLTGVTRVDVNGNGDGGRDDFIDLDKNGIVEGFAVDTDGDGIADAAGTDANGDGIVDGLDRDGDGKVDYMPPPPTAGGAAGVGGAGGGAAAGGSSSSSGGFVSDDLADVGGSVGAGGGEACTKFEATFVPKIPTVYVLVDRSTSMWDSSSPPYWDTLRDGILPVIEELQADVRLGFGTFTGWDQACTGVTPGTPFALNNGAAIRAAYEALGRPTGPTGQMQSETPTPLAINQATEALLADESPGDRFILLVTDGNPDFCDNGGPECGADAVVAAAQDAFEQGVKTLFFGIKGQQVTEELFDYMAQAGAGELPNNPDGLSRQLFDACQGRPEYLALHTASGKADLEPLGTYSSEGGTAKAFLDADPGTLAETIKASLETLKSCTFDFTQANISVDLSVASEGKVWINDKDKAGPPIPGEQWRMVNEKTLELLGAACQTWLDPAVTDIAADFPCEAIILE
jgi:von Willebrand factor type A domain